ncbi:MAG: SEL1-like repeat protein [Enhydrobacter sp.]|nr:MAG: SEL1-like repeat protein [Enhydrobacter sp.]
MTRLRAALTAALLAASSLAHAQSDDANDVAASLRLGVSAYRTGDIAAAEAAFRSLAPGNPDAEAWLAVVLLDRGDRQEGLRRLQSSVDAGSSEGTHRLGLVFAQGLAGIPRNDQRAAELFELAANAGHRRAQVNIGILYLRGQGVPRDLVQARAWLEKAATDGDPTAQYALGRAMEESQGAAAADSIRATDLYRRAAEQGHALAALRYALALADGVGIKRDLAKAQELLVRAYESGVPEAALALGDIAARTPLSRDKDANANLLQAAVSWYRLAAHAGVPSAQFKLGTAYLGGAGIERDPMQAQLWYGRAALQGLPAAQHGLGMLLLGGVTGVQDPVEGYKWLMLAERNGYLEAGTVRQKASERISVSDRERAAALAQAFVPSYERTADDIAPRLTPAKP